MARGIKIVYKLSEEESREVCKFRDLVNADPEAPVMSVHEIAKRSLFYAMNDSYSRARKLEQERTAAEATDTGTDPAAGQDNSGDLDESRDTGADSTEARGLEGSASDVLAGSQGADADSTASQGT